MRNKNLSRLCMHLPWLCLILFIASVLLSTQASAVTRADEGQTIRLTDNAFRVPKAFLYEVKADDNLHWLAAKFYGDPRQWVRIYDSNREKVLNPNILQIGQKLLIPANR